MKKISRCIQRFHHFFSRFVYIYTHTHARARTHTYAHVYNLTTRASSKIQKALCRVDDVETIKALPPCTYTNSYDPQYVTMTDSWSMAWSVHNLPPEYMDARPFFPPSSFSSPSTERFICRSLIRDQQATTGKLERFIKLLHTRATHSTAIANFHQV